MVSARCAYCDATLQPNSMFCLECGQLVQQSRPPVPSQFDAPAQPKQQAAQQARDSRPIAPSAPVPLPGAAPWTQSPPPAAVAHHQATQHAAPQHAAPQHAAPQHGGQQPSVPQQHSVPQPTPQQPTPSQQPTPPQQPAPPQQPTQAQPLAAPQQSPVQASVPQPSAIPQSMPPAQPTARPVTAVEAVVLKFSTGQQVRVSGKAVIGRKPAQTALNMGAQSIEVLDDTRSISRVHLYLEVSAGVVTVGDAGSSNGSSVERAGRLMPLSSAGDRVQVAVGDRVWIGDLSMDLQPAN